MNAYLVNENADVIVVFTASHNLVRGRKMRQRPCKSQRFYQAIVRCRQLIDPILNPPSPVCEYNGSTSPEVALHYVGL